MRNGMRFLAASPYCVSMSGGVQFRRSSLVKPVRNARHTHIQQQQQKGNKAGTTSLHLQEW